jgi:hypothetical protein
MRYRFALIDKLAEMSESRFKDPAFTNYMNIQSNMFENSPNRFISFDFGSMPMYHLTEIGKIEEIGADNPACFEVVYNHRHIVCEMPTSEHYTTRMLESLVVLFGSYPDTIIFRDKDPTAYHINLFKECPDYDFASIWIQHLNDDCLEFILSILTDTHPSRDSPFGMSQEQIKLLTNSIYGVSCNTIIGPTYQQILSAKHLLHGATSTSNYTDNAYVEQRAFIMREIHKRNLTIDETPMEL